MITDNTYTLLFSVISTMDIPYHRKELKTIDNIRWLNKNLKTRNSNHKNYTKAIHIITNILSVHK